MARTFYAIRIEEKRSPLAASGRHQYGTKAGTPGNKAKFKGRYLYGIAENESCVELGCIGINASRVYTIPYQRICAIVHDCPHQPLKSSNEDMVKHCVQAHQEVINRAQLFLGAVIPTGFNTIISTFDGTDINQKVETWLKDNYERLKVTIDRVKDKDEYEVQIFFDSKDFTLPVDTYNTRSWQVSNNIVPFLWIHNIHCPGPKSTVRAELRVMAEEWARDFYLRIRQFCSDTVIEANRHLNDDNFMLLNLTCLVSHDKIDPLRKELAVMTGKKWFSVHLSGPFPPYTFMARQKYIY